MKHGVGSEKHILSLINEPIDCTTDYCALRVTVVTKSGVETGAVIYQEWL